VHYLVSQLVDEHDGAATLVGVVGQLAQRHTHEASLATDLHSTGSATRAVATQTQRVRSAHHMYRTQAAAAAAAAAAATIICKGVIAH
jgi:hypothetical protein